MFISWWRTWASKGVHCHPFTLSIVVAHHWPTIGCMFNVWSECRPFFSLGSFIVWSPVANTHTHIVLAFSKSTVALNGGARVWKGQFTQHLIITTGDTLWRLGHLNSLTPRAETHYDWKQCDGQSHQPGNSSEANKNKLTGYAIACLKEMFCMHGACFLRTSQYFLT